MNTPQGNPAPGWYPDPAGTSGYRYWDGFRWTDAASPAGTGAAYSGDGDDAYAAGALTYPAADNVSYPGALSYPPDDFGTPAAGYANPATAAQPVKSGMSKEMKIGLGASVAVVVALMVIGAFSDSDTTTPGPSSSSSSRGGNPASALRTARDGMFQFEVLAVGRSATKDGIFSPDQAKGVFYSVRLRVTNIGDKGQTFSASNQHLIIDGKKYDSSTSFGDEAWSEDINPGLSIDVEVVFDVPPTAVPTAIEVHDSAFSGGALLALPAA